MNTDGRRNVLFRTDPMSIDIALGLELNYKEIAEIIGTTPNNIGVRVNRIKERLKKILDGKIN